MSSQEKSENEKYKLRINKTLDNLSKEHQSEFRKALIPHKFDLEIFIPKSMRINKAYESKRFLRNRLISFVNEYKIKKTHLDKLKDQTSKFSHQYEYVKLNNENNNPYLESIKEIYKVKGYDIKSDFFTKKENTFEPSFLLSNQFQIICNTESMNDQRKDTKYLERIEGLLKDKKIGVNEGEEIKKEKEYNKINFQFENDAYEKAMENMKKKIMEELKLKNMSIQELRKMNSDLMIENKRTENSIKEAENYYNNYNRKKHLRLIDDIFLSSKGMIRSAKRRDEYNDDDNNVININDNNLINRESILFPDNVQFFNEKERKKYFQKKKETKLQKVYSNILKSNFQEQEKDVKNYFKRYTDRKIENVDPKVGSNLHGFLIEFQKKISNVDIPKIAKDVNYEKRDIIRRNYNNNNIPNLKTYSYDLIDIDKMYDVENDIHNLAYNYTDDLLELK